MKKVNQQEFENFLKLPPEHYKSIIRGERPKDMDFMDYKTHMRLFKQLSKMQRQNGYREQPKDK
jgi:hypothetical protein